MFLRWMRPVRDWADDAGFFADQTVGAVTVGVDEDGGAEMATKCERDAVNVVLSGMATFPTDCNCVLCTLVRQARTGRLDFDLAIEESFLARKALEECRYAFPE